MTIFTQDQLRRALGKLVDAFKEAVVEDVLDALAEVSAEDEATAQVAAAPAVPEGPAAGPIVDGQGLVPGAEPVADAAAAKAWPALQGEELSDL